MDLTRDLEAQRAKARVVFDKKLRNRMLLRVLLTATAVMLVLAFSIFYFTRSLLVTEIKNKSRNKVELAAASIDGWLREKSRMLSILAHHESRKPTGSAFKKSYFQEICKRFGGVESVYMAFERDGTFLTGSDWVPPEGYDPRKRPWYRKAKEAGEVSFSAPYLDPYTSKVVVTIATPVSRDGSLVGVMAMDVFIDDIVSKVESLKIGRSSHAYLVDGDGLFVAHPDRKRMLKANIEDTEDERFFHEFNRRNGGGRAARLFENAAIYEGDDYVTVSRVPETGWLLFFHLPYSEVNSPLKKLIAIFVAGIGASLILLTVTTTYISHRIASPILQLARGAKRIAKGSYDQRLPVLSRDEIGFLTQSFNTMAEGLKDREFIKTTFGRYVSQEIMRDILAGNIELGGEKASVTVLFSDIRGFTNLSEGMDAHELVQLLNGYFTEMDAAVAVHGGAINKYIGDGIMAMFGAPAKLENSGLSAVLSAKEMIRRLADFNERRGSSLRVGIGIHTGDAVVGNIGSETRTEYTVIGDSVNLASRIESLTKLYREEILVSASTAETLPDEFVTRTIDKVRVKGKRIPATIYAPHLKEELSVSRRRWVQKSNDIMELYFAGQFEGALEAIERLGDEIDTHLSLIAKRCRMYVDETPLDWQGVSTLQFK
jgi:class 3 adenylate cyclase